MQTELVPALVLGKSRAMPDVGEVGHDIEEGISGIPGGYEFEHKFASERKPEKKQC